MEGSFKRFLEVLSQTGLSNMRKRAWVNLVALAAAERETKQMSPELILVTLPCLFSLDPAITLSRNYRKVVAMCTLHSYQCNVYFQICRSEGQ